MYMRWGYENWKHSNNSRTQIDLFGNFLEQTKSDWTWKKFIKSTFIPVFLYKSIKFSNFSFPGVKNLIIERSHFRIQKRNNEYFWWKQFPIREAEAMTIHNSQGRTVDGVVVYSRGLFMPGLMYTALSRARSLKLCRISHVEPENWKVAGHARDAVTQMRKRKASW